MFYYASLYLMAAAYTAAGLNHFRNPAFYLRMMPPFLPAHEFLVFASGVAEAGLGLALFFPATRVWAAWGVILLLIVVFPANLYMYQKGGAAFGGIPDWVLLLRLPLQLALIAWAYIYTRP